MSAEKKRETPELNQIVKLGIRTGLFCFVRANSLTPGSIVPKLRYQSSAFVLVRHNKQEPLPIGKRLVLCLFYRYSFIPVVAMPSTKYFWNTV